MTEATPITVAYGDGIGPEIMEATLKIIKEAGANLRIDTIEIGERIYKLCCNTGISPSAWETILRNTILLKAPITTPQGGGYKSLNVTLRKSLGLYANVRPVVSYYPYVDTKHQEMDLVIVRENEEDLYAGIEYQQTPDCVQAVKLITRTGCERIIRYAFEYAVTNKRKRVTCMSKDNIMKHCDGVFFHNIFKEIAKEYPKIENEHYIIDIGSARIANNPERFDVIVTENLYGDIISDIAAEISGSVGLAGSANIGSEFAMFEAIHGSAPDIAGKNIANPSGLLLGAVQMLVHIGQPDVASAVHNAWLVTLEDGIHTGDIYGDKSTEKVGTSAFGNAVIERLGKKPKHFAKVHYQAKPTAKREVATQAFIEQKKEMVGVDVYIGWRQDPKALGDKLLELSTDKLKHTMMSAKGLKVWPELASSTAHLTDQFRCRFYHPDKKPIATKDIIALLTKIDGEGLEVLKYETLCHFDGERGYSLGQGE